MKRIFIIEATPEVIRTIKQMLEKLDVEVEILTGAKFDDLTGAKNK